MSVMRLQRAMARAGVASRRKAEELILAGRVTVNGTRASIGQSVDLKSDLILVDGKRVEPGGSHQWLAMNKPAGVLTSASDARGRRTVFDLIERRPPGLTYVGRLDYLTEGLLLFTTDGDAVHKLTHPSSEIERVYQVEVTGDGRTGAAMMRRGVELDEGIIRVRDVTAEHLARGRWMLEITLAEGKNREVRRLCEAAGLVVERLLRTTFGPISLGELPSGKTRPLSQREVAAIESITQASPRRRPK
jgi:23S rRNA pseudouridine2605 synthase